MHPVITHSPEEPATRVCFGRLEDFSDPGPFAASVAGFDVVIVRTSSGLKAYQGRCPHQGALLGEGEVQGDTLVCRNHGWRFDAESGGRHGGPQCLTAYPIEVRGDEVWIEVPVERAEEQPPAAVVRQLDDVPGPPGWPVVGNLFQIDTARFHLILEGWARQYGPIFTYRMGSQRVLASADAAVNEQILRDRPDTFRRASVVAPVFEELGVAGVFSAEGFAWRPQRRLAMHALSQRQLHGFYGSLRMIVQRLLERWTRLADEGAPVDVVAELKRFTVDVTTLLVFSHDVNTIEQGDDVIQRKLELIFPTFNRRLLAPLPTWRWVRTRADRRVDRAVAELREWLRPRIDEARSRLATDPNRAQNPQNFLEAMLAAHDAEGRPFPDEVIFGNALTMLLAGEDTTAFTLAWAMHHLCDAPEAVAQLRNEADTLLADRAVAGGMDSAARLEFAGAVANEAMRLRPVAPALLLENTRAVTLADVAVPAGTWLALLTRPPVLQDRNFTAAAQFRPERWLDGHGGTGAAHEAGAHMPFGSGPRICPGRSLALLEMKVILSAVYKAFELERVGGAEDVGESFAFTMSPRGLKVKLHRRGAARL
jgi:cytochrome P450/nitrite reductase/ring-hydroxylating ferredoxin subunit